jgi:LPS export ABC transporter protein LptC
MQMRQLTCTAAVLLIGIAWGCSSQQTDSAPAEKGGIDQPDRVMTNSEIFLTNDGKRKATIKSDLLKAYTRVDTTLLYGVEIRFYDSTGTQVSTLTSDSARVSQRTNRMSVTGHVKAWSNDDKRLFTDSLRWDANKDKIVTEGFVEFYRGADKMSGFGLETDQRLHNVVIKRNLQGSFSEPDSGRN